MVNMSSKHAPSASLLFQVHIFNFLFAHINQMSNNYTS